MEKVESSQFANISYNQIIGPYTVRVCLAETERAAYFPFKLACALCL